MELRQLRYLAVLSETLNFTRAAERLNISQPPLTVAIAKLERELGARLFNRSNRGLTLTPAGEDVLRHARQVLLHAERLRQAVRLRSDVEEGRLHIGFVSSTAVLLPRILPEFRRHFPQVEIVISEGSYLDTARRLRLRRLDAALVRMPMPDQTHLETALIAVDEFVAAVPEAHPLALRRSLPPHFLKSETLVGYLPDDPLGTALGTALRERGIREDGGLPVAHCDAALNLVRSGIGIALIPGDTSPIPGGVRLLRLSDRIEIETGLAQPRDADNRLVDSFREVAQSVFASAATQGA
jgi:DNA-binding transcriptional LysR family regulator